MARIRSIHPDACDSEKLGALTADTERLFWRLQTHCDDEGRCEDNPRLIAARCVPLVDGWDAAKVDSALGELHAAGLIIRYEVAGSGYIEVEQWNRFQHPQRPTKSKLPPAEMGTRVPVRESSRKPRERLISGEERRGEGEEGEISPSLMLMEPPTPSGPTFEDFWRHYPRKVGKGDALKAWGKALTRSSAAQIIGAIEVQAAAMRARDPQYVPHASTWLNRDGWLDEPDQPHTEPDDLGAVLARLNSRGLTDYDRLAR